MGRHRYSCLFAALVFASNLSFCAAQVRSYISEKKANYLAIEVPGATDTYPMALNDSMTVTGYYTVSPTVARGFIRNRDGSIVTFSVLDSGWTEPESINTAGDITGFFEADAKIPQGFLRYADGRVITFSPLGLVLNLPGALPVAINDYDEIVGNVRYNDFKRSRSGTFSTPGYKVWGSFFATGLTNNGTVVGLNDIGSAFSFVVHPDGYFEQFSIPGMSDHYCDEETAALSINDAGAVAGWFEEISYAPVDSPDCAVVTATGGFVRSPEGEITRFQVPGTIVFGLQGGPPNADVVTSLTPWATIKINAEGIVVGSYTDGKQAQHGFVRETDGVLTSFDPPRGNHTTPKDINVLGVITGSYFYDWNPQTSIGFLRLPQN
jgi:hypothetical protein